MKFLLIPLSLFICVTAFGYSVIHLPAGQEVPAKDEGAGFDIFAGPSASTYDPAHLKEFRVSKVGSDKSELFKVFEIVSEGSKPRFKGTSFEIMQRITGREFLVWKLKTESYTVGNSYGNGGNVAVRSTTRPDLTQIYYLKLTEEINAVDGERLKDLPVVLTDEIESYATAATGAAKSVRVYKEIARETAGMSQAGFVERLRSGEKWIIKSYSKEGCFPCGGEGKLSDFKGGGRCGDCNGLGKFNVSLLVKW